MRFIPAMIIDDSDSFEYEYIRVEYDYDTAKHHMSKNDLPMEYATTLESGIWDNMEILPTMERSFQGKDVPTKKVNPVIQN